MTARDDKKVALPETDAFLDLRKLGIHNMVYATRFKCLDGQNALYSAEKLKSYAAARVAEATAELQRRVAELEADSRRLDFIEEHAIYIAMDGRRFKTMQIGASRGSIDAILADREGGNA